MDKDIAAWIAAFALFVVGDGEATMWAIESPHIDEVNPLMAPFVKRGRAYFYGAKLAVLVPLAYYLGFPRKMAITMAGFGAGAAANNIVARVMADRLY